MEKKTNNKNLTNAQKKQVQSMIKYKEADLKMKLSPETAIGNAPDNSGAVSFTSSGYGSAASVTCLSGAIAQGTATNNRIGNKIRLHRITIKADLQPGDNTNFYRLVVFKWKQTRFNPQTTIANYVANVLGGATSGANQHCAPVDFRCIKTLYDQTFYLHYGPVDGNSATSVPWRGVPLNVDLKLNHPVVWDAISNSSIGNDIWMMAISDSAAVGHPGWQNGIVSVWFTDE